MHSYRLNFVFQWAPTIAGIVCLLLLIGLMTFPAIAEYATVDRLAAGLASLFGTFAGAWLAFYFNNLRADRERIQRELAAGNMALFTLTLMLEQIDNLRQGYVDSHRARDDAWLNMSPAPPMESNLSFDKDGLSFLLTADPTIFAQLFLELSRYKHLVHLVEVHRDLVLERSWQALESAGLRMGEARSQQELEEILGPSLTKKLKVTTKSIIDFTIEDVESFTQTFGRLRAALKSIYPGRRFLDYKTTSGR